MSADLASKAPKEPVAEACTAAPVGVDVPSAAVNDPMESEDEPVGADAVAAPLLPSGTALKPHLDPALHRQRYVRARCPVLQ